MSFRQSLSTDETNGSKSSKDLKAKSFVLLEMDSYTYACTFNRLKASGA